MIRKKISLFLLLLFMIVLFFSSCSKVKKDTNIDSDVLKKLTLKSIDTYILPTPSVIFESLKSENYTLKNNNYFNYESNYTNAEKQALNLGVRGADGLMLLYAEDYDNAKRASDVILKLLKELDIEKHFTDEINNLIKAIGTKDSGKVIKALDDIYQQIRFKMVDLGQSEVSVLISVGGWIEAMNIATNDLKNNYKKEVTKQLTAGDLTKIYLEMFDEIDNAVKLYDFLQVIKDELKNIKNIIGNSETLSLEQITKINDITSKLKKIIEEKE